MTIAEGVTRGIPATNRFHDGGALGKKYCSYKRDVRIQKVIYARGYNIDPTLPQEEHPIVSYDEGKTWSLTNDAGGERTLTSVYVSWVRDTE
jgi:hypothetical protein